MRVGPVIWETVYQEALAIEFGLQNILFKEQVKVKLAYKKNKD